MLDFFDPLVCELARVWKDHPTAYVTGTTGSLAALLAVFTIRKQRELSREKNSLDFQVTYKHNAEVNGCWRKVRNIANDKLEQVRLSQVKNSNEENALALSTICNEWERCANAIKKGVYDEDFLYSVHASTVIGIYTQFHTYIHQRRKINPKFFNNLIWLAKKWSKRRDKELAKRNHDKEIMKADIDHGIILTHIERIHSKPSLKPNKD
ncbi:DUF4760 domain-containing protein [Modicisalibacter luteus]|uniref:DUF4760 domain-containing protein n=1 Tax=Modicisalibacter luteus TaxID=453962 RepID=A0ABV7LV25_9GAMM|nr:DUF4760 domain-containing protein [Halomonas lutea]GHB11457.1 hypothetical protein GCM10007159_37030 [Halomonas lutea]